MDPVWKAAGTLPWIGDNFRAASEVAISADDVANLAGKPLVSVLNSFDSRKFAPTAGRVDVQPLKVAAPKLVSAAHAVRQSSDRLESVNDEALVRQIAEPLEQVREQLKALRGGLDAAADTATIVPSMMGDESPRRYLLLIQNNAESRATGGIPGALAVVTIEKGKLSLGSQTSANDLGRFVPATKSDPDQELIYSSRLGTFMQDVNLTPHFPTTGDLAKKMWEERIGGSLDGVISIDPVALSYLMKSTGPIQLSQPAVLDLAVDGLPSKLTSENIVPTLLSDVYGKIASPELQDVYFAGVAKEIFDSLSTDSRDPATFVEGLKQSVDERRIRVWSAHSEEQAVISSYPISGSISGPSVLPAEFGVYFNDGTGAKMDYYVQRSAQLIRTCSTDGYQQIKVRVTSTNTAPIDAATTLPPYVTGGGAFGVAPGTVQTNVVAYGPVQSRVETAIANGKKIHFASQLHSGRPVGTVTVELPPGKSSSIDFVFDKIVQHTQPHLSVTPTVQAQKDVILPTITEVCEPAA